jgi:hypothetical protein
MQTPKKGTVKKTAKPKIKSDEKIMNTARQFSKGFTYSFKPIVEGMKPALPSKRTREDFVKGLKTAVPKSKTIRKAIESSPEYKVAKGIKKAAGFKKGGMIRTKKK